ncbi:MAG: hypothetical protein CR986_01245 [Ignavibacteriae bacterium]|nr:MAG: hypothetical protein CR986_01245 [Ignavibacteriota bacterium]
MKLKVLIIYFLFTRIFIAGSIPTQEDKKILELAINYEFDKTDEILKSLMLESNELKYHYLFLNVEIIKSVKILNDLPFSKVNTVRDSIQKVLIEYSENVIENFRDRKLDTYNKFYLGSIYGLLGRFYDVTKSSYDAYSNQKESINILEQVLEISPKLADANLLPGLINYYTDRLGGVTEFVLGILGLPGNRATGLKQLYIVEEKGFLNNWLATMSLAEIYTKREENSFEALPLIEKIVKKFPNNSEFKNQLCYEYIKLYMPLKAKNLIKADTKNEISDFTKALFYHYIGRYQKSNNIYTQILKKKDTTSLDIYEQAKYIANINNFLLGKNKIIYELNDKYQKRYINMVKKPNIAKKVYLFKKAVLLENDNSFQKYFDSKNIFNESDYYLANFNFYAGVFFYKKKNYEKAESYFINSKRLIFNDFGLPASIYLLDIYKKIYADDEKVEQLLRDINKINNNKLSISAKDLEKKYNL